MKNIELNQEELSILITSLSTFIQENEEYFKEVNSKDMIEYYRKLIIESKDLRTKLRML